MTVSDFTTCPHGKRPGITTDVCLWCRQDERMAARRRRNRVVARASIGVLGTIAVAALAIGAVLALTPQDEQSAPPTAQLELVQPVQMSSETAEPPRVDTAVAPQPEATATSPTATPATATPAPTPAPASAQIMPVVAEGRTHLGDSVFVERAGGEVTVRFDNGQLRTRFDQKFEYIVRTTLPKVFGPVVGPVLDSIPRGQFLRGGALLTELPSRGIALVLPTIGRTMMLYPVTRQGRGGPLVVAYRASIAQ